MNEIKIFVTEYFKKSVPKNKREFISTKLTKFVSEIIDNDFDIRKVSNGFSIWKLNRNIYKLRVDSANRVLFTFLSQTKGIEYSEEGILFLDYCNHDEQINRLNNLDIQNGYIETNEFSDNTIFNDEIDEKYKNTTDDYYYDTSVNITSVYDSNNLRELFNANSNDTIYYLSDNQQEILNKNLPILLFGSAGSGKTTVGIRKIFSIYCSYNQSIAYFTHSTILKKETEKIFKNLIVKENVTENKDNIHFFDMISFLIHNNDTNVIVRFEQFKEWYDYSFMRYKKVKKYDAFEIYKEIRGIIKGFIDVNWDSKNISKLLDKDYYLNNMPKKFTTFENKEFAYEVCEKYQEWLDSNSKFDENDLAYFLIKKIDNLNKFEFLFIDEIQDLTEKEIYLLYNLVNTPQNIFISGDLNQTVNPNFFDIHRVKTLFSMKNKNIKFNEKILNKNYRNNDKLVKMSNELTSIKQSRIGKSSNDYYEEYITFEDFETKKPILLNHSENNKYELLKAANDRHYVSIIVSTEKSKKYLKDTYNIESNVFTISDIKGIESKYVVCYNIVTDYYIYWDKILNDLKQEERHLYRYYFNLFYVSITRSREYICFYEEKECELYELLNSFIDIQNNFDLEKLYFTETSSANDFYEKAKSYELKEKYDYAIKFYQKSKIGDYETRIKICEGYSYFNKGNYIAASSILFEFMIDDLAFICFKEIKDIKTILECILKSSRDYKSSVTICSELNIDFINGVYKYINDEELLTIFYKLYEENMKSSVNLQKYNYMKINELIENIVGETYG